MQPKVGKKTSQASGWGWVGSAGVSEWAGLGDKAAPEAGRTNLS